jgi:hypothetical protein
LCSHYVRDEQGSDSRRRILEEAASKTHKNGSNERGVKGDKVVIHSQRNSITTKAVTGFVVLLVLFSIAYAQRGGGHRGFGGGGRGGFGGGIPRGGGLKMGGGYIPRGGSGPSRDFCG